MMHCDQIRQLFDAYLDGELSDTQRTELGAHRLTCADCRRALALLEVSGHILASDRDAVTANAGFTDRLIACIETPGQANRLLKFRRWAYIGGPIAAAAVVALAFLGLFDRPHNSRVLGEKRVLIDVPPHAATSLADRPESDRLSDESGQQRVGQFLRRLNENMNTVDQLNETTLRWLESIQPASQVDSGDENDLPADDVSGPPSPAAPVKNVDPEIEEL